MYIYIYQTNNIYIYYIYILYIYSYIDTPIYLCIETPSAYRPRRSEFAVRRPVDCTAPDGPGDLRDLATPGWIR